MSDSLLKDNSEENPQKDIELFETDENEEKFPKKNPKSKISRYLPLLILFFISIFVIYFYKSHFSTSPNIFQESILEEYNKLGKTDGKLKLLPLTEFFLAKAHVKYIYFYFTFHFNKNDVDKNRLIEAIKKMARNQAVFQSIFYEKNGKYHVKFDPSSYPEITSVDINESDYKKYMYDYGNKLDFPLNNQMIKVHLITTEKSLYCILFIHHSIYDIFSDYPIISTLNHSYLGDLSDAQIQKNDLYYALLYEYNLKLRNEKNFIKDVQDYYLKNYDLGRTYKNYHKDENIGTQEDMVNAINHMSDKSLKDKIFNIFNGNLSRINYFNMMCQLYTLYLYNNMNDHVPEIAYVRHGRNLTLYRNTVGALIQTSFLKYDFLKNSKKIKDKSYINVQEFYDNVKKQFDEQKLISRYFTSFDSYDYFNSLENISVSQLALPEEDYFMSEYMFGKKLLEKSKISAVINKERKETYFTQIFFESRYMQNGILNRIVGYSNCYKTESLQKISNLFFEVADTLSNGFLSKEKLIEIKFLDSK